MHLKSTVQTKLFLRKKENLRFINNLILQRASASAKDRLVRPGKMLFAADRRIKEKLLQVEPKDDIMNAV